MKRLLVVLVFGVEILVWPGFVSAGSGQQWGKWDNWERWEKGDRPAARQQGANEKPSNGEAGDKEKKYCSAEQEGELLALLRELRDPGAGTKKRSGYESEVRRKYRIARKLREFEDCRAEDALRELIRENACEDLGEGEILCVKWGASASLQEITSKKDLKKLSPETPLEEQLKVFRKYGPHPHENEFASHEVMGFLIEQADENPDVYVPLMVEYFTTCHEIIDVVKQYPQATNVGLKRCFSSKESTVVWAGIHLARRLGKAELLAPVYEVAFEQKGSLDYSRQDDIEEVQTAAIGFFRTFEKEAIPYYRGILYGDFERGKEYVVSGIRDLKNPDLLALLKEFSISLKSRPDGADSLLADRVDRKIVMMEEARK